MNNLTTQTSFIAHSYKTVQANFSFCWNCTNQNNEQSCMSDDNSERLQRKVVEWHVLRLTDETNNNKRWQVNTEETKYVNDKKHGIYNCDLMWSFFRAFFFFFLKWSSMGNRPQELQQPIYKGKAWERDYSGFHETSISFSEPALPLSSGTGNVLGADQKKSGLCERD